MTALPVVGRELRVASRRPGTFGTRAGAALLALLLGSTVYLMTERASPAGRGMAMFFALAWLAWLYCLLAGVRVTSDCISVERREGTLGLLFLTDLKGFDIVLGKLAATSLHSIYGLLAILPVLALPLLMGGIGLGQLLQVAAVLTVTLFFSLAVGMFVSCWFENGRRAMGGTLLILTLITGGPFGLLAIQLMNLGRGGRPDFAITTPSPLMAQALAATESGPGKPDHLLWPSVAWVTGFGLLFLVLACLALPKVWRELPRLLPARSGAGGSRGTAPSRSVATAAHRTRLLDINPFHWLTSRRPNRVLIEIAALFLMTALWLWGTDEWRLWNDPGWFMMTSIGLHVIFKVRIALAAATQLSEERRTGSMELLLSTPLTVGRIVGGQMRSLLRWGWLWLGFILLADLLLVLGILDHMFSDRSIMVLAAVCHVAALPADALAIALLAMWRSLVVSHSSQASGSAFFRIIVVPCLVIIAFGVMADLFNWNLRWLNSMGEHAAILALYALCFLNDLVWGGYGWARLNGRFREVAATRFERKKGWLRVLFGGH